MILLVHLLILHYWYFCLSLFFYYNTCSIGYFFIIISIDTFVIQHPLLLFFSDSLGNFIKSWSYLVFIFLLSKLFGTFPIWLSNWIHSLILALLLLLQQATHLGFLPKLQLLSHSLLILKTSLLILLVFLLFDIYRFIHTIIFLFLLE